MARKGGALEALFRMKEEGLAAAVGLAAGVVDVMMPLLRDWDFDVLITHNRFTPVNRNADPMLDLARERGIAVMNAAPYAGGALAKGARTGEVRLHGAHRRDQGADPAHRGDLRPLRRAAGRGGAAVLAARPADHLDDLRRDPPRAGAGDPRLGGAAGARTRSGRSSAELPFATDDPEAARDYKPG